MRKYIFQIKQDAAICISFLFLTVHPKPENHISCFAYLSFKLVIPVVHRDISICLKWLVPSFG